MTGIGGRHGEKETELCLHQVFLINWHSTRRGDYSGNRVRRLCMRVKRMGITDGNSTSIGRFMQTSMVEGFVRKAL